LLGEDPTAKAEDRARASDEQILIERENETKKVIEAEIQRKLTKAARFFAGKLTQKMGLRFAPELRFYLDDTQKKLNEVQADASKHLADFYKRERE